MNLARLTVCTYPLRDVPLDQALPRLAATGFTRLDLLGRPPHFSPDPAVCDSGRLEQLMAAAGLTVANLGAYCGARFDSDQTDEAEAELALTRRTLTLAKRLGCRHVRVRPGRTEDAAIDHLAPWFRQAAELAETLELHLGMENHAGSLAGQPERATALCRAVNHPRFGVLYDPCNLLELGHDPLAALAVFGPWVNHVHLKDGRWGPGGFERCHLGQGDVDLPAVLVALNDLGYASDVAVEYEINDLEPPDTGLPRWRAYLAAL